MTELLARIHRLGISQNAVARGIGAHSGDVSRVLREIVTSAPMLRRIDAHLDGREEDQRRAEAWLRRQLEGLDGGRT